MEIYTIPECLAHVIARKAGGAKPLSSEEIDQPPGIMVTPWGELPAPFYPSSSNSDCRCTSWLFILGEAGPDL